MIREHDNQELLQNYIHMHHLSISEFASMCGLSLFTVRNLVNGVTRGSEENWRRITKVTGIEFHLEEYHRPTPKKKYKTKTTLPYYIIASLHLHGDTVISDELIRTYGIDKILAMLKEEQIDAQYERCESGTNIVRVIPKNNNQGWL